MKIDLPNNFLETSGTFANIEFSLDNTAHAFELLLKNLYSNPISSCVRETISNAWDSHTAAGRQDTPIVITAPTELDPTFTVQDFGIGISPEKFKTVVTRIFCSDKTNSDNLIGGYGLGLKSPLAYTDQFTITSIEDGWSRNYGCYISPNGKPVLSMFNEEPTKNNNGVTIKIPVKPKDINTFQTAIKNTLTYFSSFKCNLTVTQNNILWENETVQITARQKLQTNKLLALVGCIPYEINTNHITDTPLNVYNWLGNVILKFNINELSVTPNREELNYNDKTVDAINKKYQIAKTEACLDLAEKITNCPTWELACKQYTNMYLVLESFKWISPRTVSHPDFPNQGLSKYLSVTLNNCEIRTLTQTYRRRAYTTKIGSPHVDAVTIDITKPIVLHWLPAKTKRLPDCLKKASLYLQSDEINLLLTGDAPYVTLQQFKDICCNTVTLKDIAYTAHLLTPKTRSSYRGTILTTKGPIDIQDIDETHDVYIKAIDKAPIPPWNYCNLENLKSVLPQKIRHIIYNHKSHNKMLKDLGVPDIEDLAKQMPNIVKNNIETLQRYKQTSPNIARYLNSIAQTNPDHPPRSKLIKFAHDFYIDEYIKNLYGLTDVLNLNIPKNPTITKELDGIYKQYQCFFDENINIRTCPKLLAAYDQYLETNP